MTKQIINIGTSVNKGNGDPLRTAFQKINENFSELYTAIGLDDNSLNFVSLNHQQLVYENPVIIFYCQFLERFPDNFEEFTL
jgi:hypothetical protein